MNIFSLFTLCGGIAFFLYGMTVMSSRLEKLAGGRLEQMLRKMTDNPFKSLLLGAGITIAIQSSSAMTVMLVGLVNSGIMQLGQTVGVIMGSNVGTTLTAWILSLSGIDSESLWLQLLKPENFAPVIALAGVIMRTASSDGRRRSAGSIMVGFALLMTGMEMMKEAVSPLADMPEFTSILTAFTNPFLGVIVGAIFTGIIQSSAASVGILQALSMTGGITYGMALPIIMGQNIGTCVTALLSSIGVNRNARRVSVIHISFNLIGTAVCLAAFYGGNLIFHYAFLEAAIDPAGVALVHSIFNIATTALLLPFSRQLERLAYLIIKEDTQESSKEIYTFVDSRLLATPSVAIAECANRTVEMARLAEDTFLRSLTLLDKFDEKVAEKVTAKEDQLDRYEDQLGTFLVQLSSKALSESDSRNISKQLHTIGDFERIGDHAVNLLSTAREIHEKDIRFSGTAEKELTVLTAALKEILRVTTKAFAENDLLLAARVEPLEQVIDGLIADIKSNHIARLQKGNCTIEMGFVLSDLLTNCERVSDHCSNIAVAQIETAQNAYQAHEYLNALKHDGSVAFREAFESYRREFAVKKETAQKG
ncbi:MAG: Na/Pi cotransporter family protein [Oscillospiraceae bacterium]|jgi:phosphate:Na+ symporter|nr:Na/Pi cotransporter family protein [Oscillospiraceae bacterium]MDE6934340.1 Na/Pi cotransporter family protein [Oscillospiraceae bacterium]